MKPDTAAQTLLSPIPAPPPISAPARAWLAAEYTLLFYALPLLYYLDIMKLPLIPYLCAMALVTTLYLLRRSAFDRTRFWNFDATKRGIGTVFAVFVVNAIGISLIVYFFLPERFLDLPGGRVALWAMIMIFYPLVSVYPQEIIYRVFLFERYKPLFGASRVMILASAVAFGFGHIIMGNWIAVPMSLIGGILFAITYARSKSALLCSIEHALYGDLIFTIGLGSFFYAGDR